MVTVCYCIKFDQVNQLSICLLKFPTRAVWDYWRPFKGACKAHHCNYIYPMVATLICQFRDVYIVDIFPYLVDIFPVLATRDTPTCWWSIFVLWFNLSQLPFFRGESVQLQKFIPHFHHLQCQGKEIQFKMCLRPTVTSESRGGASFRKVRVGLVHFRTGAKRSKRLWIYNGKWWKWYEGIILWHLWGCWKMMSDSVARRKEKELLTWDVWMRRGGAQESLLRWCFWRTGWVKLVQSEVGASLYAMRVFFFAVRSVRLMRHYHMSSG